jgi:hypothetical protein
LCRKKQVTGNVTGKQETATAAKMNFHSVGIAGADSISARTACWKTSGECPAMQSPGSVLTAEIRMVLEISDKKTSHACSKALSLPFNKAAFS